VLGRETKGGDGSTGTTWAEPVTDQRYDRPRTSELPYATS
jgi:hypothetical protein